MTFSDIEREAQALPIADVVRRLVGSAGIVVTGAVGNAKSASVVHEWTVGVAVPEREEQLRFALVIAHIVESATGASFVQSWFKGANSDLGDRAPAIVLRNERLSEVLRARVLNAARRLGSS